MTPYSFRSLLILTAVLSAAAFAAPAESASYRFGELDRNNDGRVSRDEWPGNYRSFVAEDRNRDGFIDAQDSNGYGRRRWDGGPRTDVDFTEFNGADPNRNGVVEHDEWVETGRGDYFAAMDADRDGNLTAEEYLRSTNPAASNPRSYEGAYPAQGLNFGYRRGQNRFRGIDRNQDGILSRDEWPAADAAYYDSLDRNRDGVVTRNEFFNRTPQQASVAVFSELDSDGNGSLSRREWLGNDQDFAAANSDHDDVVSEQEFRAYTGASSPASGNASSNSQSDALQQLFQQLFQ
ncbi:MAG TPA: hypothetical protein VL404_08510 [Candidatus Eisenbacteria bacterium]|nr:hypothetical protein [Candidatus Eisenbacteria bacterium]